MNRLETACLTGYRPIKLPWFYDEKKNSCIKFKEDLSILLSVIINSGIKNFLVGMAEGFDMIGAEILLELRTHHKDIRIIAVIPCVGQEKKWSKFQQIRYHNIIKKCDETIILAKEYTNTCMNDRNKYMVDNSSTVIACFSGKASGTKNTIMYAKEKGIKVHIINPEDYK